MMSIVLPSMTAGIANRIMNAVTKLAQTNSGMRVRLMPGARILSTVVMVTTAATSPDTSVNVMSCAHQSERLPGVYCGPDSGVYMNQPASGPMLSAKPVNRNRPPNRKIQ